MAPQSQIAREDVAQERSISLGEVLGILLRNKLRVAILAFLGGAGALAVVLPKPPTYNAEARVLVEGAASSSGILGELALLSQAPAAAAEIEVVRSRVVVEQVVAEPEEAGDPIHKGLVTRVDDYDRFWPLPVLMRFLRRQPVDLAPIEVRIEAWPERSPPFGPLRLHFPEEGRIAVSPYGILPRPATEMAFHPEEPVTYQGARFLVVPQGPVAGRTFILHHQGPRFAVQRVLEHLSVEETARGSGVLRITYEDTDPERAAEVANAIAQAYVKRNIERLRTPARLTREFIEQEKVSIKEQLETAEERLVQYQAETEGAVALSENAEVLVSKLSELDLEQAKLDMQLHQQRQARQLFEQGAVAAEDLAVSGSLDPLTVSLLESLAEMLAQKRQLQLTYTDRWPELVELNARIAELRDRIAAKFEQDIRALEEEYKGLGEIIQRYRVDLESLPETERQLAAFQREAKTLEEIYLLLLQKLQEATISERASIASVDIIDPAQPPLQRSSPKLATLGIIGGILGALLGAVWAFVREPKARRIASAAQLEEATGLPQFGIIPDFRRGPAKSRGGKGKYFLAVRDAPQSPVAEAYRSLRANLKFAAQAGSLKTLAVTSSVQAEGKSVTIVDLAVALANSGASVLLVDADMRRPVVHRYFGLSQRPGLSDVLLEGADWQERVCSTAIQNLSVLPAGQKPPNPGDLLASEPMTRLVAEQREQYDYVLFDVPPVLAVADPASFLHELDAVFLLCRAGIVPEAMVAGAAQRLRMTGVNLAGAILNGVRPTRFGKDYYYGYGYHYGYGYSYGRGYKSDEDSSAGAPPPAGT